MQSKQIRNMALIFALLVLLVLLVERPWSGRSASEAEHLYPGFSAEGVDRIHVENSGETVDLVRHEEVWIIGGDYPLPADTAAIHRALNEVGKFTIDQVVSQNAEKFGIFEVDSTGAIVQLFAGDEKPVVDLLLGKSTPEGGTYFRPSGEDRVYSSPDRVRSLFVRQARAWEDRKMFDVEQTELSRLVVERGDSTIVFEKEADDTWALREPLAFPVKQQEMDQLLRGLCKLVANAFPDSAVNPAEAGFDQPMLRVKGERIDGAGIELLVGTQGGDGMYLAKASDREWVYKIAKYRVDPYYKDLASLEAEPPPPPAPAEESGDDPDPEASSD
jgi:hypothetical protein